MALGMGEPSARTPTAPASRRAATPLYPPPQPVQEWGIRDWVRRFGWRFRVKGFGIWDWKV